MRNTPLPPMQYTMRDFKKWCKLSGHHPMAQLFENFSKYCLSDYCMDHFKKESPEKGDSDR